MEDQRNSIYTESVRGCCAEVFLWNGTVEQGVITQAQLKWESWFFVYVDEEIVICLIHCSIQDKRSKIT